MSPKTAKLTQRIQNLQQFVASKIDQDATYADIAEKLEQISTTLTQGKLNLQICGHSPILTDSLEDLLNRYQALEKFYQICTTAISDVSSSKETASPAVLVAETNGTPYSLPTDRKTILGRRLGNNVVLPQTFSLVSGQHLEIIPPITAHENWTISDLNSTNGTFVNGQRVQGDPQVLQSGDRVVLGATASSDRAAGFLFECESNLDVEPDPLEEAIAQADILCLVFDPSHPLSREEKHLIEQASKSHVSKIALVADLPPSSQGNPETIDNIKNIEEWLKNHPAQLICLSLRSSYSQDHDATVLAVDKQDELNHFYQELEQFGQSKLEDILIQRGTQKAMAQVARIEEICDQQQAKIIQEMNSTESKLQVSDTRDLKEQLKKEIKNATQEKDALFKEIKYEMSELKNNLLSENFKVGLPYKIQQFVDSLSHIVTKTSEQNHIYICLPADELKHDQTQKTPEELSSKVHRELYRFFQEHLNYVAAHEWHKICNEYSNGGLNRLFQQTGDRFSSLVPTLNLSGTDYQPPQEIDINKIFLHSSVEYPWEVHYSTTSFLGYVMKNIRTNMISIGMMVALLTSVGGAIGVLINMLMNNPQAQPNTETDHLTHTQPNTENDYLNALTATTTIIGFSIAVLLVLSSYPKEKKDELEQNLEKIKSDRCKDYKYVAKELINKMLQLMNLILDTEEKRFKKMLEIVEDHSADYTIEAKNTLTQLKAKEMELKKERLELEKLKRF